MLQEIIGSQPLMARQGVRRLLVLSGTYSWQRTITEALRQALPGEWLWLGESCPTGWSTLSPAAARTLLGQERLHACFDATEQLDIEALAVIAGALAAGSWLVLLTPGWAGWPEQADRDSIRWSDSDQPVPTPHFVAWLQQQILSDPEVLLWREEQPPCFTALPCRPPWQQPDGNPTQEQQQILQQLYRAERGIWVLTAGRGRGKSALAGMLAANWSGAGSCWLTSPGKESSAVLQYYAQGRLQFLAPDVLSARCHSELPHQVDWLLVDEAAAIPLAQLYSWLKWFPRVLLITTVQGYEGTGRGFLLKLCAGLPAWQHLTLIEPIRWAAEDPLQRFIDSLLLFQEPVPIVTGEQTEWCLHSYQQVDLLDRQDTLKQLYLLLTSAHYRTRPLDLRRLMDAPGMHFTVAESGQQMIGAVWSVDEGGLDLSLAREIWAGRRRPRGNLVAQSMAAHAGQWQAPALRSRRISRIAVEPLFRRRGIASALIKQQLQQARAAGEDYLAVSFGFTAALWAFWQQSDFQLVRIGSHREVRSGCYVAMAIVPLTLAGQQLAQAAGRQLRRDWHTLPQEVRRLLKDVSLAQEDIVHPDSLESADWLELAGFAFAHRTLQSSQGALLRLLALSDQPLDTLRSYLLHNVPLLECVAIEGVSGKKALLACWRAQVAQALSALNTAYCQQWQSWVLGEVGAEQINSPPWRGGASAPGWLIR
ncbi:MAG: tRNA(Met) cytidine acetyltransferase TmcA [Enterobacteriaceae bacterium]